VALHHRHDFAVAALEAPTTRQASLLRAKKGVLGLGEKSGLGGCIFGVAKVAQAYADEAKTLRGVQADALSER